MANPLAAVATLLKGAGVGYAIIGAHAVNAWLEPRFTAGVDLTVELGSEGGTRLRQLLEADGYRVTREHGAALPSGPDFVRFTSSDETLVLGLQIAKTEFQREVVRRAVATPNGLRVATIEDLVVMKLIANRRKDRVDLDGLVRLPGTDWAYVEHWAAEWGVGELLLEVRRAAARA